MIKLESEVDTLEKRVKSQGKEIVVLKFGNTITSYRHDHIAVANNTTKRKILPVT